MIVYDSIGFIIHACDHMITAQSLSRRYRVIMLDFREIISIGHQIVREGRQRKRGLTDSEIAVLYCAWHSIPYKEFIKNYDNFRDEILWAYKDPNSEFSSNTLPAASSRLMSVIEKYLGTTSLNQRNFRAKMLSLQESGALKQKRLLIKQDSNNNLSQATTTKSNDGQSVNHENHVGRYADIETLKSALISKNLILLRGFAGSGKTTLLDRLSIALSEQYRYFYTDFGHIADLEEWMIDLLSQSKVEYNLNSIAIRNSFFEFLETRNNLIALDSVGKLSRKFLSFLETFAIKQESKSRIIVSSRERIHFDIPERHYYIHELSGLNSPADIHSFFSKFGLEDEDRWIELSREHSGNIRELNYVCRFIKDYYKGSVSKYLNIGSNIISANLNEYFSSVNFTDIDIFILSICARRKATVSEGLISALRQDATTNETLYRIDYLADKGFLECSYDPEQDTINYSISPLVKNYLIREGKIRD